jgi:hypothetical protein
MVCNWHLKDTRWGEGDDTSDSVSIHTLCININEYEFCMIDYTVNALDGYEHEWTEQNIKKAVDFCKPILKAMDVKGELTIKGISLPKTEIKI